MPPRKSKTPRSSVAHTDATSGTPNTDRNASYQSPRPKTDWQQIDAQTFPGFKIEYYKDPTTATTTTNNKKRKFGSTPEVVANPDQQIQQNPFPDAALPDTIYSVKPADLWDDTSRYRKFTISSETFAVGDVVSVKASEDEDTPDAPIKGWVAKVLEVRAGDEQHVYLRIYWMYRPEDLPGGRQPYHGRNEVIASNDMQIIDATSVNSKLNVKHWVEQDDQAEVLDPEVIFWRQTHNIQIKNKNKLSLLRNHCIDKSPCNPDQLLIQCTNPPCQLWLHASCIEEDAVKRAYKEHDIPYPDAKSTDPETPAAKRRKSNDATPQTNGTTPKSTPKSTPKRSTGKKGKAPPRKSLLSKTAELIGFKTEGPSESDLLFAAQLLSIPLAGRTVTRLMITDHRPDESLKTYEMKLQCLKCHEKIEEGEGEEESDGGVDVKSKQEDSVLDPIDFDEEANGKVDSVIKEEYTDGMERRNGGEITA